MTSFLFTLGMVLNDILISFSYSLFDFRFPCMHNRQLRNNAKLLLHPIPYVTTLNSFFSFCRNKLAEFFNYH